MFRWISTFRSCVFRLFVKKNNKRLTFKCAHAATQLKTPVPCVLLSLLKVQAHLSQVCFRLVHSLMDERGGRPLKPHLSVGGARLPALSPVRWFVKAGSRGDVDVSRDESSNFARNNTVNLGFLPKYPKNDFRKKQNKTKKWSCACKFSIDASEFKLSYCFSTRRFRFICYNYINNLIFKKVNMVKS